MKSIDKLDAMFFLLSKGKCRLVFKIVKNWLYSNSVSIGMDLDLDQNLNIEPEKIHISIREFNQSDFAYFDNLIKTIPVDRDTYLLYNRLNLMKTDLKACYIGVTDDNTRCYIIWMINSDENDNLRKIFGNFFPLLKEDEILLEDVYVTKKFRGVSIYTNATSLVCEIAKKAGKHRAITFVDEKNASAIRASQKIGFKYYTHRFEKWRLLRRSVKFQEIPKLQPDTGQ